MKRFEVTYRDPSTPGIKQVVVGISDSARAMKRFFKDRGLKPLRIREMVKVTG